MLEFHVTNGIFYMVKNGWKLHEYRDFSEYWKSRLSKINEPTNAMIVRGYTKDKISILITDVSVIPRDSIETIDYRNYIKTEYAYDIEFKSLIQGK